MFKKLLTSKQIYFYFVLARKLVNILSEDMEGSKIGLLYKFKSENIPDDIILRLFSDLMIAAIDTVSK